MKRFNRMLCVYGGSESERGLLERVVAMARNNQAALTVVEVVPQVTAGIGMPAGGPISRDLQVALVAERTRQLDAAVDPYRGEVPLATEVIVGSLFLEVIRRVRRDGHDLVVKVPEDPEWLQGLFGSDDMHLLRKCPCPVWLLKPPSEGAFRRVLAAVDVSPFHPAGELETRQALNRRVLELAASVAMAEFAELHVVYAWQALAAQSVFVDSDAAQMDAQVAQERPRHAAALEKLLHEARMTLGAQAWDYLVTHEHMPEGHALREIPRAVARLGIDLVVMGTVARTGIPGLFMGNTAEAILGQVDCSVLAIKPPGFVSPVQ